MDKLKMHSPNLTEGNIAKLAELFPSCVTEARDAHGKVKQAIDFDQLRQELSDHIVEGPQERYHLNWPGKRDALLAANAPIAKTLRPYREESVDFDNTKNLFIEGDNLEALKLLQETYLGKIKMVYIDPPYNTGNDFLYKDDFKYSGEDYLSFSNQKSMEGVNLVANKESNGRMHSDWLSMIHSRLKVARNLLVDNGVIFVSIDDNEHANLRKILDEIFGSENFIADLVWQRRSSSAMADNNVSVDHEYVVCYQKGAFEGFHGLSKDFGHYSNPDQDPRGDWVAGDLTVGMNATMRPNQAYDLIDPKTGVKYPFNPNRVWAYIPVSMDKLIGEGRVIFPKDSAKRPMLKRFKSELKSSFNPFSSLMIKRVGLNTEATRLMNDLMGASIFEYSKPLSLLENLISQVVQDDGIVMDFFAGSGTTAHAVMNLNARDGKSRKCISVQLPEHIGEKSHAYKSGYRNICEISRDRIKKASDQLVGDYASNVDKGFRTLKIDSSNLQEVYYQPGELRQDMLSDTTDNIRPDRTPEDLLFQVLLDWGVDLSLPIAQKEIAGKTVYFVDGSDKHMALAACFDLDIDEAFVKQLAGYEPLRAVFRDAGFANDSVKINVEQIFAQKSPNTDVKVI